ncbi:hypothetical protein B0H13DRAFT_1863207 [Mycena leptocephala]|nr:hypothetical protein B0H13DRAFT_1863207 [Mycena leptocephala]
MHHDSTRTLGAQGTKSTNELLKETGDWRNGTRKVLCSRCLQYVSHGFDPGSQPMDTHWTSRRCQDLAILVAIDLRNSSSSHPQIPVASGIAPAAHGECLGVHYKWEVGLLVKSYSFVIHD